MYLRRPFSESEMNCDVKFHWSFATPRGDPEKEIEILINRLDPAYKADFLRMNVKKHLWRGCFGGASIISLNIVESIEAKYQLFSRMVRAIYSRELRMAWERVFALALFIEKYTNVSSCDNFGSIFSFPGCFVNISESELNRIDQEYSGAIIKTFHGR
jgi:hypothetical protein